MGTPILKRNLLPTGTDDVQVEVVAVIPDERHLYVTTLSPLPGKATSKLRRKRRGSRNLVGRQICPAVKGKGNRVRIHPSCTAREAQGSDENRCSWILIRYLPHERQAIADRIVQRLNLPTQRHRS